MFGALSCDVNDTSVIRVGVHPALVRIENQTIWKPLPQDSSGVTPLICRACIAGLNELKHQSSLFKPSS